MINLNQPYNHGTDSLQHLLITPQTWPGVSQPVSAAQTFVISPLARLAPAEVRRRPSRRAQGGRRPGPGHDGT